MIFYQIQQKAPLWRHARHSSILLFMHDLRARAAMLSEWGLLVLVAFSLIWRGGKGLEATWLLAAAAVMLTFVYWGKQRASKNSTFVMHPMVWMAMILFLGWSVLSFLFSATQNYGLDELLRDASLTLIAWWMAARRGNDGADTFIRRLMGVLAMALLVSCAFGVAVYVLQPVNRFVGTFFDWRFHTDYWPNAWAQAVLLLWPAVVLWSREKPLLFRILTTGFVLGALLLSYSRGAFLAFCLQLALLSVILFIRWLRSGAALCTLRKQVLPGMLQIVGVCVVALMVFIGVNAVRAQYHSVESVARKATFTAEEGSSSISERRDFWEQSLRLSMQRPWLGWGPYSFRFVQPRLQTEVFATSDHPHNVFLKLAMERGWPAAIFFAAFLLMILLAAARSFAARASDSGWQMRALLFVAVAGVLAHNQIDYNLQFTGIALPFWLMLGCLAPVVSIKGPARRAIRICEILLAVLLGCTVIIEGRLLALSSLGRHAEVAGKADEALYWYDRARGQLFSRDMHMSRAALYLQRGDPATADAALDDYAAQNAQDPRLWILRGYAATALGDADAAYQYFTAGQILGRYDYLEPMEGVLRILSDGKHREDIAARKDEFLQTFNAFGEAILHNAHFIALSESVETFGRVSSLLQTLYPSEKATIATLTTAVLAHAQEERAKSSSRTPGMLW